MAMGMGYILVKCEKDVISKVYKEIEKVTEVKDIYAVNGEYDILAKIVTLSPSEIPRVVLKIRKIPGVHATKTLTVVSLEA